jgi:beta propeller repeat protein
MVCGFCILFAAWANVTQAGTKTFVSTDVPMAITDNATVTSTINVVGHSSYTTDVSVAIANISHTSVGQLEVSLINPAGIRIKLFGGVGGGGDNFVQTVLHDRAPVRITSDAAPFTGQFQGEGVLAQLNSENPNGTWKLEITDTAGGETGTLYGWSLTISAGEPFDWLITTVTDNSGDDTDVHVCGSLVVWSGHDGSDWEIFLCDVVTAETTQVTSNGFDDKDPRIWAGYIVWTGYEGADSEIFLYDTASGLTTRITNDSTTDQYPQIRGSKAVWEHDDGSDFEIFMYDVRADAISSVSSNNYDDIYPYICGSDVVWEGYDGFGSDIFFYDAATGVTRKVTDNSTGDWYPQTHGSNVVYSGHDGVDTEVYLCDQLAGTTRITDNGSADSYPVIYGSNVIWNRYDGSDWEIMLYDVSGSITTQVTDNSFDDLYPQLCGSNIVWSGGGDDEEILHYNIASGTTDRITDNGGDDSFVQVCGSTIVWQGHDGNDWEIFVARRKVCMASLAADMDGDCRVGAADFAQWAAQWLECQLEPPEACWQ